MTADKSKFRGSNIFEGTKELVLVRIRLYKSILLFLERSNFLSGEEKNAEFFFFVKYINLYKV